MKQIIKANKSTDMQFKVENKKLIFETFEIIDED